MCRSLEEFRAAYVRITQEPPRVPDAIGPTLKAEPSSDEDGDDNDDHPEDHQRYRLVVKREPC